MCGLFGTKSQKENFSVLRPIKKTAGSKLLPFLFQTKTLIKDQIKSTLCSK